MTSTPDARAAAASTLPRLWWLGFAAYALLSAVHVTALAVGADELAAPSKIALMPMLFLAVGWSTRKPRGQSVWLLLAAITASWLGDSAGFFFAALPTLPLMIGFFAVAHLLYIWLFMKHLAVRRFPRWSLVYALWWIVLVVVLWPHLGSLAIAVALYGLVLGGTAAASTRASRIVTWGGALFLTSDTLLAFLLFTPQFVPPLTDPAVMLSYTAGQGLIAVGAVLAIGKKHAAETQTA